MFGRNKNEDTEAAIPLTIEATPIDGRQMLLERAMLWRSSRGPAYGVVEAAVQCLVEGIDTPLLCELAGATHESATNEVYDLWPKVAEELGLTDHDPESRIAEVLAARAYVRGLVAEGRDVQDVARITHKEFHHGGHELIEALISRDDEYAEGSSTALDRATAKDIVALLKFEPQ